MTSKTYRRFHAAYPIAVLILASVAPVPARAEFFDDVRRTFQTDIPHFFQDDIPCAFGGQPTSHTKTSCKASDHPARQVTDRNTTAAPPARARAQERPQDAPRVLQPPEYP